MKRFSFISVTLLFIFTVELLPADKILKIEHSGLINTQEETVRCKLQNKEGCEFSEQKWLEEKDALMDLDIFAGVDLTIEKCPDGTKLKYCYKELPYFIIFPAMKRTDQDGLLIGPGVTFTNIAGLGIREELLSRYTVIPDFMKAKEFTSYTKIPELKKLPLSLELTINYFESYNSLKIYNEQSLYNELNSFVKINKTFKLIVSSSAFFVKHDNEHPFFTPPQVDVPMFYGKGKWDYLPSLGAGFAIDTREREMNPHRGFYNEYKASLYGKPLGGDSDFKEYVFDFRGYIPAGKSHIFHGNILARYRPGDVPGYELYHAGGVNSLRVYEPDPSMAAQHEALWTFEYRYELFTNRQISLWGFNGYYGLQIVTGMDNCLHWMKNDSFREGTYYNSFYGGIHILVPFLERIRIEMGLSGFENDRYSFKFGANAGWYEKCYTQRRRVR